MHLPYVLTIQFSAETFPAHPLSCLDENIQLFRINQAICDSGRILLIQISKWRIRFLRMTQTVNITIQAESLSSPRRPAAVINRLQHHDYAHH